MKNQKIELALMETGLRKYQLAKLMGISESTFGRMMREELSDEKQEEIVELIKSGGLKNE